MERGNWQKVFETKQQYQAEIVKAVLEENDLNPVIINKQDTAYHLGLIEVHVNADDVIPALKIIKDEIKFE